MRNLFRRPARIEAGSTVEVNGHDMQVITVTHYWEPGEGHRVLVTLLPDAVAQELPVPIPYGNVEGESACSRCAIPIREDETRGVYPNAVLCGPELLDIVLNVAGAGTVVVCNACVPQLRGTLDPRSLPAHGASTITFSDRGQANG
jgi:hypothetical protein